MNRPNWFDVLVRVNLPESQQRRRARTLQILILSLFIPISVGVFIWLLFAVTGRPFAAEGVLIGDIQSIIIVQGFLTLLSLIPFLLLRLGRLKLATHIYFILFDTFLILVFVGSNNTFTLIPALALLPVFGAAYLDQNLKASLGYAIIPMVVFPLLMIVMEGFSAINVVLSTVLVPAAWLFSKHLHDATLESQRLTMELEAAADSLQSRVDAQTESLRRQAHLLQLSVEVGRTASTSLDQQKLMQVVVKEISKDARFKQASIFLTEEDGRIAELKASWGGTLVPGKLSAKRVRLDSSNVVGWVAANRKPKILSEFDLNDLASIDTLLPGTISAVAIPMVSGDELFGILTIQSKDADTFQEEDLTILQIMGDQVAGNLRNARLFARSQRTGILMARLPDLSAIMAQQASVESAVEALCFHVSNLLNAAGTFGWLLDTSSSNPRLVASYHQDAEEVNRVADSTLPAKWLRVSEPIIIDDLSQIAPEDEMPQFAPMRVLAMPLKPGGKSIGLIAVIREAENQPFASEEVQFVSALALQVSAVVNNMELLTQTRKLVYRERILNEVSQNIRRSLDVETILDTTSRHLSSALGNRETRIQLAQHSGEAANE